MRNVTYEQEEPEELTGLFKHIETIVLGGIVILIGTMFALITFMTLYTANLFILILVGIGSAYAMGVLLRTYTKELL